MPRTSGKPTSGPPSRGKGRVRKWLTRVGASVWRALVRVLRFALGKPERSPGDAPPAAGGFEAPPSARPRATSAAPGAGDAAAARATPTARTTPTEPATPPSLGTWVDDRAISLLGSLDFMPLVPSARDYRLYEPVAVAAKPHVLVVLHGCRQNASDIATGTRLNDHADERGWPVLYPEQTRNANKWNCWNWFDPANVRGHGETALVATMLEDVAERYSIEGRKAFLAGMSAGGALASILALRYPERWAAVAVHSGLPYGAAEDPFTALKVMKEGAKNLTAARALRSRTPDAPGVAALIFHGNDDDVVHRRNAELLVRQFLGWNGYFGDEEWDTAELPKVDADHVGVRFPQIVGRPAMVDEPHDLLWMAYEVAR